VAENNLLIELAATRLASLIMYYGVPFANCIPEESFHEPAMAGFLDLLLISLHSRNG